MVKLEIRMFPVLQDNYCYLIHDGESGLTGVVDTPDVSAIKSVLQENGWTPG